MTERKLNVFFAFFAYGGNGGTASEVPDLREWFASVVLKIAKDDRVDELNFKTFSDTPITMTRGLAVETARLKQADVLIMVDSDQKPDMYVGVDPDAKPFWDSSFDFLYKHWEAGPTVIMAPYCGPPPHPISGGEENVYSFYWATKESPENGDGTSNARFSLEQYSRYQAATMSGIQPCGAGPTGLSMWDMRAFNLVRPPYFYYEWDGENAKCQHCMQPFPGKRTHKASTEDVTATRDVSLNGIEMLGYNPVFTNWDSWAGHWKPRCVGKPIIIKADHVSKKLADAVKLGARTTDKMMYVGGQPRLGMSNGK